MASIFEMACLLAFLTESRARVCARWLFLDWGSRIIFRHRPYSSVPAFWDDLEASASMQQPFDWTFVFANCSVQLIWFHSNLAQVEEMQKFAEYMNLQDWHACGRVHLRVCYGVFNDVCFQWLWEGVWSFDNFEVLLIVVLWLSESITSPSSLCLYSDPDFLAPEEYEKLKWEKMLEEQAEKEAKDKALLP